MTSHPNVLIMSDQEQHWSHLPAELHRPGTDWLLGRGMAFEQHHAVTVPCGPSRSTIYTGQHTQHTKVLTNPSCHGSAGMASSVPTLGTMLRAAGYYTAYKGKWHVSVIEPPTGSQPTRSTRSRSSGSLSSPVTAIQSGLRGTGSVRIR